VAKRDPNKELIEKTLNDLVSTMLTRIGTSIHEWDYDKYLRNMLRTKAKDIKKYLEAYDQTFELSFVAKTTLNKKYKEIYKIKNG